MATVITSKVTGKRTLNGTDWPVETILERRPDRGRRQWVLVVGLCNGVPQSTRFYATWRGALNAFEAATA